MMPQGAGTGVGATAAVPVGGFALCRFVIKKKKLADLK